MFNILGVGFGNQQVDQIDMMHKAQEEARLSFAFHELHNRIEKLETRISKLEASPDVDLIKQGKEQ